VLIVLAALALMGWSAALALYLQHGSHVCPIQPPTHAVLVNASGLPESVRHLRKDAPETYSRPHGREPATIYYRIGTAALYQPKA